MLVASIVVWCVSLYLYNCGWHESHKALSALSGAVSGMLLLITLNALIEAKEISRMAKWLSGISYEVYLVHLPLIPIVGYLIPNTWLMLPIWVIVTFACAVGVNHLSNRIIK